MTEAVISAKPFSLYAWLASTISIFFTIMYCCETCVDLYESLMQSLCLSLDLLWKTALYCKNKDVWMTHWTANHNKIMFERSQTQSVTTFGFMLWFFNLVCAWTINHNPMNIWYIVHYNSVLNTDYAAYYHFTAICTLWWSA